MKLYTDTLVKELDISRSQLAGLFGVSERTLDEMEDTGSLYCVKENKVLRLIRLWEVVEYLKTFYSKPSWILGCLVNGQVKFPDDTDWKGEALDLSLMGCINAYPSEPESVWKSKANEAIEDFDDWVKNYP